MTFYLLSTIMLVFKWSIHNSNHAVVGLSFYDNRSLDVSREPKPSARGESEITDVTKECLRRGQLQADPMGRGFAWLDTWTHESLVDAMNFVKVNEERQGLKTSTYSDYRFGVAKEREVA